MNAVEFSDLIAAFGAYCLEVAPKLEEQQVYVGLQSVEKLGIPLITGVRDEKQYAIPFTRSILQKGRQLNFNPVANAVDFIPRKWKMRAWQVDLQFDRTSFDENFLQHYKSASRNIQSSNSLVQYCMALLMKRLKEDLELAIWQGVYNNAPAAANVAEPLEVVDGFLELIRLAILSGEITAPIVTGPITSLNAIDSYNAVWKGLDNKIKMRPSRTYSSIANVIKFVENYVNLNGDNNVVIKYIFDKWIASNGNISEIGQLPPIPLPLSGGLNVIQGVWGMGNSNRLICKSEVNNSGLMAVGMGDEKDVMGLNTQEFDRKLKMLIDGSISCQFGAFEIDGETYISVNDQL